MHGRRWTRLRRFAAAAWLLLAAAPAAAAAAPSGAARTEAAGPEAAAGPCWPMDLPERHLTSGFMEWRPGRFHAGIDLKTRSQTGFPVRAIEDGEVVRLRTAASGYGLALHLRGRSGRSYVYAHLERFADRLQAELRPQQAKAGRWSVDVALPAGRLPVRRGEVLALSGQSGTPGPHLHLEVRNAAEMPLDPQDHGLAVRDRLRPRIRRLRALPVEPSSRIEGRLAAFSIPVPAGAEAALPPLRVRGAVALTAEVDDTVDEAGHRLAPDLLRVWLDERAVYSAANDSFAFADGAQAQLEWLELGAPPSRWLHLWPGNTLPGRRGESWSAAPGGLPPGRHRVVIEALDGAGNRTAARFELVVDEPGAEPALTAAAASAAAAGWRPDPVRTLVALPGGRRLWLTPFLELELASTAAAARVTEAVPGDPAGYVARPLLAPTAEAEAEPDGPPHDAGADPLPRKEIHRAAAGGPLLADAALWVLPDGLSATETARARSGQGLEALGPALRFAAGAWPASGPVEQRLPPAAEAADPRDGIYRQEGQRWAWAAPAGDVAPGTGARFGLRGPGRYALLRDLQPPVISAAQPDTVGLAGPSPDAAVTLPRWRIVAVGVRDEGSGVDPGSLTASLAGRPLLPQPDLIRGRLLLELPDDLPPGRHVIVVEASDRAGNRTRREVAVHCRPAPAARR